MTPRLLEGTLAFAVVSQLASCGADRSLVASLTTPLRAHGKHVDFTQQDDDFAPPDAQSIISPRYPVTPYTQWNANNGYCGELSSIEAGMSSGQWMSQFNARSICGAGLSQSGPDNFCAANGDANYNAQFLFEAPNPGDNPFASAPTSLANARLAFLAFDYAAQPSGMAGYRQFMAWVKARVIAGDVVAVGVLNRGGDDPQYDHEVTVTRIGTNHSPTDAAYYDDDVLYFEDHGSGGAAYTRGFTFASLAQSRDSANGFSANAFSILIPGGEPVLSGTGGDGINLNPHPINPTDYAFAVAGPRDLGHETLPVTLLLTGSSVNGTAHAPRSGVNLNYESPEIGRELGSSCTNQAPTWMDVTLEATVAGLTSGVAYNLYEYDIEAVDGTGAALAVPEREFNTNAGMATKRTHFVANAVTYTQTIAARSSQTVVVRCVPADAL